jgi:hypothetical protein
MNAGPRMRIKVHFFSIRNNNKKMSSRMIKYIAGHQKRKCSEVNELSEKVRSKNFVSGATNSGIFDCSPFIPSTMKSIQLAGGFAVGL